MSTQPQAGSNPPDARESEIRVGQRIRERRIMLGLTQQQLAARLGITYQQAHKYERAINRVSAGRLHQIAYVLDVPISFFFEEPENVGRDDDRDEDTADQRMRLELAQTFARIRNHDKRHALIQVARAIADCEDKSRRTRGGSDPGDSGGGSERGGGSAAGDDGSSPPA